MRKSAEERFWEKVDKNGENGCWIWTAGTDNNGYGLLFVLGHEVKAHRFAYELLKELIPKEMVLDHLCRNRLCINPDHLEPVTLKENILRGVSPSAENAKKTHCIHGHEFTKENTGFYYRKDGRVYRRCKACNRKRRVRKMLNQQ